MSLRELLKGIDETETESSTGWWETSKGSEFGALILNQALALEAKLEAESQALRNELDKYKKQVANDDKHLEKASFVELERDQLRNELEALRGDSLRLGKLIENGLVCSVCGGGGFIGNPPDDYQDCPECKKSINKIKADAVMSIMKLDCDCETPNGDIAWSSNTIEEYANKLEQCND